MALGYGYGYGYNSNERPGWGFGDKNHVHTGPPGLNDKGDFTPPGLEKKDSKPGKSSGPHEDDPGAENEESVFNGPEEPDEQGFNSEEEKSGPPADDQKEQPNKDEPGNQQSADGPVNGPGKPDVGDDEEEQESKGKGNSGSFTPPGLAKKQGNGDSGHPGKGNGRSKH